MPQVLYHKTYYFNIDNFNNNYNDSGSNSNSDFDFDEYYN